MKELATKGGTPSPHFQNSSKQFPYGIKYSTLGWLARGFTISSIRNMTALGWVDFFDASARVLFTGGFNAKPYRSITTTHKPTDRLHDAS